ncbi:MAG: protein rep [Bacteroidota bacterium]
MLHFCSSGYKGTHEQRSSFITASYRHKNLKLAEKLEDHTRGFEPEINKVIRNLRFCSSLALVESYDNKNAAIVETSHSCKNPHCAICARNRATKLTNRLLAAIRDPGNKDRFDGKYFYFLTLTVKHDANTRQGIYLDEFNGYFNSLVRSSIWKKYFPTTKISESSPPLSGWIHNRECTLTPNGYHIHAHILLCAPRLTAKAKDVQAAIRDKWLKITGDSNIVRFDLIRFSKSQLIENAKANISVNNSADANKNANSATIDFGAIREVFKYSVKSGQMKNLADGTPEGNAKMDNYVEWILKTKGKNFINCSGLFRGLQITGAKSKYDEAVEKPALLDSCNYAIGKTSDIRFNYSESKEYSKTFRKKLLEKVYVKRLWKSFQDVSDIALDIRQYLQIPKVEADTMDALERWIAYERKAKAERDSYLDLAFERKMAKEANAKAVFEQLDLFEKKASHLEDFVGENFDSDLFMDSS